MGEKEKEVLIEWCKFVRELDPDIITGYNITGFDFHGEDLHLSSIAGAVARGNIPLQVVVNRILPHINKGSPIIFLSNLEDDPTIVSALRDFRARNFDVTVLSPSSLEFEFDAKRIDRTGYEVLKTERDVLIGELRGLGVNIMDWEPDMLLSTALAGARGF